VDTLRALNLYASVEKWLEGDVGCSNGSMESKWELAGLHLEVESESGFRWECRGGRIGGEACGHRLDV
jgi:hypothetical protein